MFAESSVLDFLWMIPLVLFLTMINVSLEHYNPDRSIFSMGWIVLGVGFCILACIIAVLSVSEIGKYFSPRYADIAMSVVICSIVINFSIMQWMMLDGNLRFAKQYTASQHSATIR